MTYLEVLQGLRNKAELAAIKKMLDHRSAVLLPLTESITQKRRVIEYLLSPVQSHAKESL